MTDGIAAALGYIDRWLDFQLDFHQQPGAAVAIVHKGALVYERGLGIADLRTGEPMTARHRVRAASHSKSFTAAAIMLLRERGELRLDDPCGDYVPGLAPGAAAATIGQLLSHSGGISRDGPDSGQFLDRVPYRDKATLLADLAEPAPIEAGLRLKYSNHGYGLLGLVIEAVTGRSYAEWMAENVVGPAGLSDTTPDIREAGAGPIASGHSGRMPLGRRVVIPARNPTAAMAAAAGFVATASDLARFYAQLDPAAATSILSVASRREMTRRHWRDEESALERYYGFGIMSGPPGPWAHFGHSGGFQGFITRTLVFAGQDLAVSVVTNAVDGPAYAWSDGIGHILRHFSEAAPPPDDRADWSGRWWSLWGAVDLVPCGETVLAIMPVATMPFVDATEIAVTGPDTGRITKSQSFGSPGETVRLVRDESGTVIEIRIAGAHLRPEAAIVQEMEARYGAPSA